MIIYAARPLDLKGESLNIHSPHPQKELKRYAVKLFLKQPRVFIPLFKNILKTASTKEKIRINLTLANSTTVFRLSFTAKLQLPR